MKKVSIIVLICNVSNYVRQCLLSLMNQTYKNIEIVAVIGKSDTKSMAICEELAKTDDRIVLLPDEQKGISESRNMGVRAATGDYIAFVDGDDYVDVNMIETLVTGLESENADISVIGKYYYYKNKSEAAHKDKKLILDVCGSMEEILLGENFFLHLWDKLYKRELFNGVSFRTGVACEDRLVCTELLMKSKKTVFIPKTLYYFRQSLDSCSKIYINAVSSLKADIEICEKIIEMCPNLNYEVELFLIKEYVSMVQTSFLYECFSKDHDKEYLDYIKKHVFKALKSKHVYKGIIIKALWCAYFPKSFGKYTLKRRQEFLDTHEHFSSGTDWSKIFEEQGIKN